MKYPSFIRPTVCNASLEIRHPEASKNATGTAGRVSSVDFALPGAQRRFTYTSGLPFPLLSKMHGPTAAMGGSRLADALVFISV